MTERVKPPPKRREKQKFPDRMRGYLADAGPYHICCYYEPGELPCRFRSVNGHRPEVLRRLRDGWQHFRESIMQEFEARPFSRPFGWIAFEFGHDISPELIAPGHSLVRWLLQHREYLTDQEQRILADPSADPSLLSHLTDADRELIGVTS